MVLRSLLVLSMTALKRTRQIFGALPKSMPKGQESGTAFIAYMSVTKENA